MADNRLEKQPAFGVPEGFQADPDKVAAVKKQLLDAGVTTCFATFVDVHGVPKAKATPIESFEKMCNGQELYTVGAVEGLGLAVVKRKAPRTRFVAKDIVDVATVKAVARNRYHVLKLYGAKVIGPVLREEMRDKQPKKQLRRLRKWLVREDLERLPGVDQVIAQAGIAKKLLRAHNRERKKRNRPRLKRKGALIRSSRKYANVMAANNHFSHTGPAPDFSEFFERIRAEGFNGAMAENIARGQRSVGEVMRSWMRSSGHRKNILSRKYKYFGEQ